jgi:DNA-binding GntR family transcriptional regulator
MMSMEHFEAETPRVSLMRGARIVAELSETFFDGTTPPGQVITEDEVARSFVVSRATARAAITTMVRQGVLNQEPHMPARVPQLSAEDRRQLMQVRTTFEGEALSVLIRSNTDTTGLIAQVHTGAAALRELEPGSQRLWLATIAAEIAFHGSLIAETDNRALAHDYQPLAAQSRYTLLQSPSNLLPTISTLASEHIAIIDAVGAGQVTGNTAPALSLLAAHLTTFS